MATVTWITGGMSLLAVGVSLRSLWLSNASYQLAQRQLDNARNHQRLTVRPYLFLSRWVNHQNGKGEWTLILQNTGVGPALIESVQVWVNGKEVEGQGEELWDNTVKQMFSETAQPVVPDSRYGIGKGFCLGHGQKLELVKLTLPDFVTPAMKQKLDNARMLIRYKSFYDDPHECDTDHFLPKR